MGMENDVMLTFLSDEERFADTFNAGCFHGEQIVPAEGLSDISEISRPSIREIYEASKQSESVQKPATLTRDIIKTLPTGQSLKIVAIESQSDIHYLMPWRIMNYDDSTYKEQIEQIRKQHESDINIGKTVYRNSAEFLSQFRADDKLNPVYTLCVYHGTKPWDGPRTLKDMMNFGAENPELWEQLFADYPMRLLCLNEIEDFSIFQSSAKYLFKLLPHRQNKTVANNILTNDPTYLNMDNETANAVGCLMDIDVFMHNPDKYKTEKGGYNMCQAMQELRADWYAEGRTDTLALNAKIFKFIQANNNIDSESIAAACECTLDDVIEFRTAFGI